MDLAMNYRLMHRLGPQDSTIKSARRCLKHLFVLRLMYDV